MTSKLALYLSAPQACSYLPEESSSSLFIDPAAPIDMRLYGKLLQRGFRRSGKLVYRPQCEACQQCLSVRIPVAQVQLRRRHQRILRRNAQVELVSRPARFEQEHFQLYRAYTASRHAGGSMAESTPEQYLDFLQCHWSHTQFIELRESGRLLAVAVTDQAPDGLSAVYTFFDPELPQRSLGTFSVLTQFKLAAQRDLPYIYLGYWIRDCRKMSYKADFRPLQVYSAGKWREFATGEDISVPELGRQTG